MKKYFAAAFAMGIAIGPASALEAGIGGKAGGVGIGAGVSAGSQGGSVGVGASVGGVGGANVGASVGAGSGSVSASGNVGNAGVSASGNVGTSGAGVSTSVGLGADSSAQNGSAAAPGGLAAATTGSAPTATATATTATTFAKAARQSMVLPPVLRPSKAGQGGLTVGYPFGPLEALTAKPGTPAAVVQACRAAIMSAAKPLGAVRVRAVSAGALRQFGGARTAPIKVRIDYARRGGIEVRQAQVGCRLDKAGRVRAVI
ncbi:hypothetical protein [Mesorhizobium sp. B2-1-3A]|uniref:hypothetical protein n=1 Tax=Mesorhizobium sp. B2-1-3A TaxID=2589971 RepID=UPI0015E3F83B|nr:hypothetical protein [Mesorhizobium sp. B2-1-3A]